MFCLPTDPGAMRDRGVGSHPPPEHHFRGGALQHILLGTSDHPSGRHVSDVSGGFGMPRCHQGAPTPAEDGKPERQASKAATLKNEKGEQTNLPEHLRKTLMLLHGNIRVSKISTCTSIAYSTTAL